MNASILRASFGSRNSPTSKSFTAPEMRVVNALASKCVIGPMPERPSQTLRHAVSKSLPTGDTIPRPVTTTLRLLMGGERKERRHQRNAAPLGNGSGFAATGGDVIDRLLDRGDLLRFLVRNLGLELLLEGHHQLDRVQRIGAQVVDEGSVVGDLFLLHAQLLGDDALNLFFNAAHSDRFSSGRDFEIVLPPGFPSASLREPLIRGAVRWAVVCTSC